MWEHCFNYVFVVACVVGCAGIDLPQRLRIICICVSVILFSSCDHKPKMSKYNDNKSDM